MLVLVTIASRAKRQSKMKNANGVAGSAIHAGARLPMNASYVLSALLLTRSIGEQVSAIAAMTRLRKSAGNVEQELHLDAWAGAQGYVTPATIIARHCADYAILPSLPKSARLLLAPCIGALESAILALILVRRRARHAPQRFLWVPSSGAQDCATVVTTDAKRNVGSAR